MRIHMLQHVPYDFLTTIEKWAGRKRHVISKTALYRNFELPRFDDFELLVILGGPMSIYEEDRYPWMKAEKEFIAAAVEKGKLILGICLGGQLLADALGSRVYRNEYTEIGWHPVSLTAAAEGSLIFSRLPKTFTPFLWHEYAFEIPQGARRVAESEGCVNQAFEYEERLIGLQFHIEASAEGIKRVIRCCGEKIVKGKYVQRPREMLDDKARLAGIHSIMERVMEGMEHIHNAGGGTDKRTTLNGS